MDAAGPDAASRLVVAVLAASMWPSVPVAALLVATGMRSRGFPAGWRYTVSTAALFGLIACTGVVAYRTVAIWLAHRGGVTPQLATMALWQSPPTWIEPFIRWSVGASSWLWNGLALGWIVGILVLIARCAREIRYWRRTIAHAIPSSEELQARVTRRSQMLGIVPPPRVAVLPDRYDLGVVGLFRPVIIVGDRVLGTLDPESLELLLLHELIHIRRRDCLMHAIVLFVGTAFFFYPVVLWLTHRIREEREDSTDDLVLAHAQVAASQYCRALLALAEVRISEPVLAISALSGHLRHRVARLAHPSRPWSSTTSRTALTVITLVALTVSLHQAMTAAIVAGDVLMRSDHRPLSTSVTDAYRGWSTVVALIR